MDKTLIDITGQRFGRLVVLKKAKRLPNRPVRWICQCDCGKIKPIYSQPIRSGRQKSCGCLNREYEDLVNQTFGNWIVLKRLPNDEGHHMRWKCKCIKCNNISSMTGGNLKECHDRSSYSCSKCRVDNKFTDLTGLVFGWWTVIGRVQNSCCGGARWNCKCKCGKRSILATHQLRHKGIHGCRSCTFSEWTPKYFKDLTGMRFDKWFVVERAPNNKRITMWKCQCDCGTIRNVSANSLTSKKSKGCRGCAISNSFVDLTGKRYNRLVVVKRIGTNSLNKNAIWLCQCDCGNTIEVESRHLNYGAVSSCKCYKKNMTSLAAGTKEHIAYLKMIGSMYWEDRSRNSL